MRFATSGRRPQSPAALEEEKFMKCLIVTADDFGLTKSINEGIEKTYKEGIVKVLSFIPAGEAFEDAVLFAKQAKLEGIGAHLALTQVSPVTDPVKIPTLVSKDGKFYKSYAQFLAKFFIGAINPDEIYLELKNQMEKLHRTGLSITNLSSHEHIHMVPGILKIFIALSKEYNIPYIRCLHSEKMRSPFSVKKLYKRLLLPLFSGKMEKMLKASGVKHTSGFLGFLDSGALQEKILLEMIRYLKDGATELVCHPGFAGPEVLDRCIFHANCETETSALTSRNVRELIDKEGIRLARYEEIN